MRLPTGLLLVEARRPPGLGDSNAEPFPFVAGFAAARRLPVRWICLPREAWAPTPEPFLLDLGPAARRAVVEQVEALGASHLLLSEAPAAALEQHLAAARPGLRVAHCASPRSFYEADWLLAFLGLDGDRGAMLPDLAAPSYRTVAVAGAPPVAPTPLIGSAPCLYAAPVAGNPAFAGVDLGGLARRFACTFCPGPADLRYPFRTPPVELALRQIAAVRAAAPTLSSPREFIVRSAALFFAMSELLARLEAEAAAPLALYFACRPDEVLARAADVAAALASARRGGHEIHIFSMGVESFSPAENERFNKRLATPTIAAALAQLRRWEQEHPETFFFTRHGGLGFILFTPWTTLDDLRLNLEAARGLGLEEDGFFLTRRLMFLGDTPLRRLAARDGLLDPDGAEDRALFAWLQRYCDPGCRHFHEEEDRPWRFREPVVARVCALTVRAARRDDVVADDPYHPRIAAAVQASGLRLLEVFATLLAVAGAHRDAPLETLLEAFLGALPRAPGPAGARRSGP